jgi:outer membrane protein assembly factor BamB
MVQENNSLYLGTFQGEMVSLDIGSQEINWRIKTGFQVRNPPLVDNSEIYWANVNGELFKIYRDTGEFQRLVWLKIPTSGSPVKTQNGLLLAGEDMILYRINTENGSILTRTEFDGRLRSTPIFIQKRWFIAVEDHWLYEIQ